MSLPLIHALRLRHKKPGGVVSIVFSDKPSIMDDSESMVVIRSNDDPCFIDLRPLVGLSVALYSNTANPGQVLRTVDLLAALGCKFFGVVTKDFVLPMLQDATPRHTQLLTDTWRALCP